MRIRTISLSELSARFEELASLETRTAAIGVDNPGAAAYARVIEYGSVAGQRPWPHSGGRTVSAVDSESGAQVIVSAHAPQGFIRVHAPEFLAQLRDAVARPANWLNAEDLDRHFAAALQSAAAHSLEEMRAAVPHHSGQLAQSLTIASE
ncbi:MAG: hypothetical protein HY234_03695 [Acidobacteria bacterium]|nr:hypothetical protein [Acidobacteriota bacterium]MBI3662140.1 hypothetical protein [Acidobacteriota bacterium]